MAYVTKSDQIRYIELGSFVVDYKDGDVLVFDSVKDLSPLYPLKSTTMLLAYCTKGWQQFQANGQSYKLSETGILVCPHNTHVTFDGCSSDFDCKVMCISDTLTLSILRDMIGMWHSDSYIQQLNIISMPEPCKEEFDFYYALIRSKLKRNNPTAPYEILLALLRALLLELHYLLKKSDGTAEKQEQKLSQGKMLFNRFLSIVSSSKVKRQPITFYAGQLAITPKYLTMLCLKYSNKTASEWVAQYTVEEIRYYLKSTELSIKEISALTGFSNMSHFGSYVRKHLGVSPSEYRFSKKG